MWVWNCTLSLLHYYREDWIEPSDRSLHADLCVYGATSAGIISAYRAAKEGLSVVVLNPGHHVGGMTSGGLGLTDFGNQQAITGLSRRFYELLGEQYGREIEWRFEPHVASAVYDALIAEADLAVYPFQYLDHVEFDGSRIVAVVMLGGLRVEARQFIDAGYEGDLLAKAKVSHHIGREPNSRYGESLNGIQVRDKHQFGPDLCDPYRIAGDPASGLLPYVEPADLRKHVGEGDRRLQAYNFRLCMTNDPALKIPWERPEGFDPMDYELAARWFQGEKSRPHWLEHRPLQPAKFDALSEPTPGGFLKTDTNNEGAVSSDFIGGNWRFPEASYAEREAIFQQHVAWQRGLYWFVANDPRIPDRYRDAYAHWGLASDEFKRTDHWPPQLYIRESRRMIGDYVVTEADCMRPDGFTPPEDVVGMGSYTLDSHNCTRFVAEVDGRATVLNEGDVQVPPTDPYPISYRAIVPPRGECQNLIVPVCISASHIAYGSARMEPVFMMLGESAACAASLAIRRGTSVQDVPAAPLRQSIGHF